MLKRWFWGVGIGLILVIGFLTLRPSFNLALMGDDYLGLWRYNYYIQGQGGPKISNWSYFFTDYGPMDIVTAIIHHYYGFQHQTYYIFSFGLRLLASLSFLWPVYRLTKSKWASLGAAGFFLITTTGLEATDWSFNMPSYLAIALTNIFLGCYISAKIKDHLVFWIVSPILFVLTIISQPVRTMFLPILIVGLEIYWLITNFNIKNIILGLLRVSLYVFLITNILKYTSYGGAVSLRGNKALSQNFQQVVQLVKDRNYKVLASPISQLGQIILPNDFMYQRVEIWGLPRTFRRVVIPAFVVLLTGLIVFKVNKFQFILASLSAAGWTVFIWKSFMQPPGYLLQPFELLTYLLGGYSLIIAVVWWVSCKSKELKLGIVLSLTLIISGFILFWVRAPGTLYEITARYLIIPGAGLAWLMGILLATAAKTKNIMLIVLFGLLFSLHAKTSYKYLSHLSDVRGIELTDRLRNSVQGSKDMSNSKIPIVYYFEGDNPDILHHAFIFGWPVIAAFRFNFTGPWYHIAPTDKWDEIVSAYVDGKSLKRFMPEAVPAKLENIFAYRLENRQLIDETEEKRQILLKLKTKPRPRF